MTKYITFGIMYGREAPSLAAEELQCSVREAQQYINNFAKRFGDAWAFLQEQRKFAVTDGWLETPFGRRRRFPFVTQQLRHRIENQANNFPIQSMASDINLEAFCRVSDFLSEKGWGSALFLVHDSVCMELREEVHIEALRQIRDLMEAVVVDPDVKFEVDVECGPNWGAVTGVTFAESP
jgi:DNA polymerase-1